ncbi:MAG: phosphatase PAP2 family protein, partial [Burkholderiales bacterium]|nr:phosphatase PAP2 family protein [Burkholderiales bacterium]
MSNKPAARKVAALILSRFWFKTFGISGFTTLFFVAYLYLLKHPAYHVAVIPTTWFDEVASFQPAALPIYLSLWVYLSGPPVLMTTRREITGYGVRIAALCLVALGIFYFWPNAVPPVHIDWSQYPSVAFLKNVDAAGNACPSLHVATAVFSALWLHWRLPLLGISRGWRTVNIVWCVAIAYSTMATKQHVAIDVAAGTVLALAAAW